MKYTGKEGTTYKINTASPAPAIQSVKITNVKQYQVTVPAEYKKVGNSWKYYKAHKVWKTSFKAKITFKKKPKNIQSMYATFGPSGHLTQKANSKSTTNSITIGGKYKGKTIKVTAYSYSDVYACGKSKVATKSVKLK